MLCDVSDVAFIPYLSNHAAEQNVLNHIFTARKTWRIGQTNSRGNTERPRKKAFKGSDKAIHIQRKEGVREVVYEMMNVPADRYRLINQPLLFAAFCGRKLAI